MYNISFKAYNNKKLKQIHRNINTSACRIEEEGKRLAQLLQ